MPFLERAGCAIYYAVEGSGGPLLFIHGGSCSHEDWELQVEALRGAFTVVTVDLRGHGASVGRPEDCNVASYASDVCALLRALDLVAVVLVGHSLGTRVALEAARRDPTRIAGLVLIDGSIQAKGTIDDVDRAHAGRFGNVDDVMDLLRPQFEGMFFDNADPAQRARVLSRIEASSPEVVMARSHATLTWDATQLDAALAAVTVPTLAIQSTGTDDAGRRRRLQAGESTAYLDRLRARLAGLETTIVTGVGHFSMLEAPAAVNAAIRDFAERVAG